MSLPVFIDINVDQQLSEIRSYLKSCGAEISDDDAAIESTDPITNVLEIIQASDGCWAENNDTDIEMVFNGIISLVNMVADEDQEPLISLFCEKVGTVIEGDKRASVRLKLLSNLFYGLPERSILRGNVYCTVVRVAAGTDLFHTVPTDLDQLKVWFKQWSYPPQKIQQLLRLIYEGLVQAKSSDEAIKLMVELLGTYTEDNASDARDEAHRCIVSCLGDPKIFLMDHLLSLKPVKYLEGEPIHDLLTIFVSGKLNQYLQFYKNHSEFINSSGLSHELNLKKMSLLTFMQLSEGKKEIDFVTIQNELNLEENEVEDFIIDVLRYKVVQAKIDHIQRKVVITNTAHRMFGRAQWQQLRRYLDEWSLNLNRVQNSLLATQETMDEALAAAAAAAAAH